MPELWKHLMIRNSQVDIVIVGNGSISVNEEGARYTNARTGHFLREVIEFGLSLIYIDLRTKFKAHSNLNNFCLRSNGIDSFIVNRESKFKLLLSLAESLLKVVQAKHVYLFYPGTLSKIIVVFCLVTRRKYGLYLRGENYAEKGLDGLILSSAKFIFTVSPLLSSKLKRICDKVEIIRPMVELNENDRFERSVMKTHPPYWKFLFVGRVETDKGINELIEAMSIIKSKGVCFELRIVGGGPLYEDLCLKQAENLNIRILGLISDKTQLMREYEEAHMLILPSYHEGFPRVLYEAMMKSLPIITTFVGGIPAHMKDSVNCLRIPVRSSTAIAEAIEILISDFTLLHRLGANGLDTVYNVLKDHKEHSKLLIEQCVN